jgi:hypothetical protein
VVDSWVSEAVHDCFEVGAAGQEPGGGSMPEIVPSHGEVQARGLELFKCDSRVAVVTRTRPLELSRPPGVSRWVNGRGGI